MSFLPSPFISAVIRCLIGVEAGNELPGSGAGKLWALLKVPSPFPVSTEIY
jgi:hypothetical protein